MSRSNRTSMPRSERNSRGSLHFSSRRSRPRSSSMEDILNPPTLHHRHPNPPAPAEEEVTKPFSALLVFLLLVSLLFSLLDTTIVSTSLLETAEVLGDAADASWIMLSYLLTYMGFSIIFAKMSDIFGRLVMLELSWFIFAAFSLGCGVAQTMSQLIVMRAFQGIGGAGLYSLPFICIHEIIPCHRWHIIGACVALTLSVSYVLGPVLGGIIPHLSSWRLLYLINIPIAGAVSGALFLVYPRQPQESQTSISAKLRQIDFLGALLLLAGSMTVVYSIQEAGSMKLHWNSATVIALLVLSTVCWIAFWCWEAFICSRGGKVAPIFPMSLASHRVYLACLFTTFLLGFVFMTSVVSLPERSQVVENRNVLMAGVELLPLLAAVAVGTFSSVPFTKGKNRTALSLSIGAGLMTLGTGLMTIIEKMSGTLASAAMYCFKFILGLGFGMCLSSTTIMANVLGRGVDMAVANGAIAQIRVLGSAIGLSMWTVIFNTNTQASSSLSSHQGGGLLTPEQAAMLQRSPANALMLPEPARSEVRRIYAGSFTDLALVLAMVSAGAFAMALCTYERDPLPVHLPPQPTAEATAPKRPPSSRGAIGQDVRGSDDMVDVDLERGDGRASESDGRVDSIELGRVPTRPLAILRR